MDSTLRGFSNQITQSKSNSPKPVVSAPRGAHPALGGHQHKVTSGAAFSREKLWEAVTRSGFLKGSRRPSALRIRTQQDAAELQVLAMSPGAHGTPWQCLAAGRASRRLVLVVVFVALLLDNMLLTVVGTVCSSHWLFRVDLRVSAPRLVSGQCWQDPHTGRAMGREPGALRTPTSGQYHSVQLRVEPENGVKSLINPFPSFSSSTDCPHLPLHNRIRRSQQLHCPSPD